MTETPDDPLDLLDIRLHPFTYAELHPIPREVKVIFPEGYKRNPIRKKGIMKTIGIRFSNEDYFKLSMKLSPTLRGRILEEYMNRKFNTA